MKGVMRFGVKGKLTSRYIGLYIISKRVGNVSYELELLQELAAVHLAFQIYMMKNFLGDPSLIVPKESVGIKDNLFFDEVSNSDFLSSSSQVKFKRCCFSQGPLEEPFR